MENVDIFGDELSGAIVFSWGGGRIIYSILSTIKPVRNLKRSINSKAMKKSYIPKPQKSEAAAPPAAVNITRK